jgi:D-tyrosyl-tRNA(Tyr) deacylase
MRAVIQRVSKASVKCESGHSDEMATGLLVFLGIEESDTTEDIEWLGGKISRLRIFNDSEGQMNLSLKDVDGDVMVISQFTLHASTKKGNRPSYIGAAKPDIAIPIYEKFITQMENDTGKSVKHGIFGDHMDITLLNDGPVTIIIDTKNRE